MVHKDLETNKEKALYMYNMILERKKQKKKQHLKDIDGTIIASVYRCKKGNKR